jgi:hypothetical protein
MMRGGKRVTKFLTPYILYSTDQMTAECGVSKVNRVNSGGR